jgi:hypothetical protein
VSPALMIARFPTVMPPHTTAFPPILVLSPTLAGFPGSLVGSLVRSSSLAPGPGRAPGSHPGSREVPFP